jgi:tRNA threonylcarbamoyladenosine biosynthesis protein TsaB
VASAEGGHLLASDFRLFEHYAHAETLNPMIQSVMKEAKRNLKDLEAVAVSSGPGSYTGLRIGISSAKGFCYGLEIPLIAISSLEIMADAAKNYEGKHEIAVLVPMMDARRMEVYSATFDKDLKRIDNDKAIIVDENFTTRFEGEKIYYFGDGMPKCISVLEKDSRSVFIDAIYPDAKNMIKISLEKFRNSEFEDLAYFEPEYLKEFNSHK